VGPRAYLDDALVPGVGAVVLLLFLADELRIAGEPSLPLDDSWIHLRFADNLAAGRGFAINPPGGSPARATPGPRWASAPSPTSSSGSGSSPPTTRRCPSPASSGPSRSGAAVPAGSSSGWSSIR
jgi:hypothetical protein